VTINQPTDYSNSVTEVDYVDGKMVYDAKGGNIYSWYLESGDNRIYSHKKVPTKSNENTWTIR